MMFSLRAVSFLAGPGQTCPQSCRPEEATEHTCPLCRQRCAPQPAKGPLVRLPCCENLRSQTFLRWVLAEWMLWHSIDL